jgi:hypothetical protein
MGVHSWEHRWTWAYGLHLRERAQLLFFFFQGRTAMPQFVIEREMPGVGKLSSSDLKGASQGSCKVIRDLGPEIQWVHSYVTDDKIYCVYRAPSADLIRRHAETAGFPANSIAQVRATIDPTTAE